MNTPFSPIANRHNPKAAYSKIYQWVLRFGSPTILSSSCENPILMNYQSLAQSNCWVTINYDRVFDSFFLSASNGIATPAAKLSEITQFLDAAMVRRLPQLELDPSDNALWTMVQIELTDTELQETEIETAFNRICKAIDDSAVPILSIIYGGLSVEEAIAAYEKTQTVSLTDWRASLAPWESPSIEPVICH
ncbi:hypothetical protein [Dechloromonas sp. CZR5]|uniref:hypothetical protein n=1 Tax=Dechloromonas sp. CZR5 TaxID=2608630 RepID=UPI00123D9DBE|nr:hypothetical protein [Dechloromonas sp. CZR5]